MKKDPLFEPCNKCGMSARAMFYAMQEHDYFKDNNYSHNCKPKKPFTIDLVLFIILSFGVVFMLIFAFIVLGWYISTLI